MNPSITFLALLFPVFCNGQEFNKIFYDKNGVETEEAGSEYYTMKKKKWNTPNDTLRSYYTHDNSIRSLSMVNSSGALHGSSTQYHKNGNVKVSAFYKAGSLHGQVTSYYPEGRFQSVEYYNDESNGPALISYWDSLGNQIIKDGTGFCHCVFDVVRDKNALEIGKLNSSRKDSVWVAFDDTGRKLYEEEYKKGELINGVSFDTKGNQYEYTVLGEMAEFPGGMQRAYEHVAGTMQYPKAARKAGIEGKVFVEFVIEKDGAVTSIKLLKGIGGGCDEVAMDAISSLPDWKCARQRGRPVKQKMVMPLFFKLK